MARFSQKSQRIRLKKKQSAMLLWIFPPKSMPTRSFINQTMKYFICWPVVFRVCWISWMKQFLGFGVYNRKCQKPQQFWEWMNSLCHSAHLNIGQYCGFIIIHWCESDDLKFFAGFLSEIIKFLSVKIDAIAS